MEDIGVDEYRPITILDVLGVDLCARAILQHVSVAQLVRSERVSRRWQRAVLDYLTSCRTLSYEGFRYRYHRTKDHRTVSIGNKLHSLPLVRKTLEKWGPYIKKLITDLEEDTYLDIIVSTCPNLVQIQIVRSVMDKRNPPPLTGIKHLKQLNQIVLQNFYRFSENKPSDLVLGELFQDINCENITIRKTGDLSGTFLKYIKSTSLKSLTLARCRSLSILDMISVIDSIRNLTSLELEESYESALSNDVHLLLLELPQLEEFTLRMIHFFRMPLISEEWIEAFRRLGNLKRLTMMCTRGRVNDEFLQALAFECRKLEYLEIRGSVQSITARGVTALCRRSPSARTTLHFPVGDVTKDIVIEIHFIRDFKRVRLYEELAALGCVELTLEWFSAACRDPRGRELPLNLSTVCALHSRKELKLIIR